MTRLEKVIQALHEQRRINMQKVVNSKFGGSPSACDRAAGLRRGFVAQLAQHDSPIPFGERLARRLELALKLSLFQLDR